MSSGQTPRNPRYFPNMKVRGVRRRRRAPWEQMGRQFDELGYAFIKVGEAAFKIGPIRHIDMNTWEMLDD